MVAGSNPAVPTNNQLNFPHLAHLGGQAHGGSTAPIHRRQIHRQRKQRDPGRHQSGHPGDAHRTAVRHPGRNRSRRGQRQGHFQHLARDPHTGAGAADAALPGPAQAAPKRHRPHAEPGDRQDLCRRPGRRLAGHRGGGACLQHRQPHDGRDRGERGGPHRLLQLHPTHRRVRRHHALQLPGDDPAVDVSLGHRLRQHLRAQALRTGSHDAQSADGAVRRSRRPGGRAAGHSRRQGPGQRPAHPPGHPRHLLRGLGAGGAARLPHRHPAPQARAGHGRRQEPHGGDAGRQQGPGHQQPGRLLLRRRRPALHGHQRGRLRRRGRRLDSRSARGHGRGQPRPLGR